MKPLPHTHSCFVCGESNASGLQLRFETDGRIVQTRFVPGSVHTGFKGMVHGGILASVLDEIMVWACVVSAHKFVYSAELTVRYIQPVTTGQELIVIGELVRNRKDRVLEARATAHTVANGSLVEATGKYRPIKGAQITEFASDLVGDTSWLSVGLCQ